MVATDTKMTRGRTIWSDSQDENRVRCQNRSEGAACSELQTAQVIAHSLAIVSELTGYFADAHPFGIELVNH